MFTLLSYVQKARLWPNYEDGHMITSKSFQCIDCGSEVGYRSRPRTFLEKYVLPFLFLRPVRCGDCFRRSYMPVSVEVRERRHSHLADRAAA